MEQLGHLIVHIANVVRTLVVQMKNLQEGFVDGRLLREAHFDLLDKIARVVELRLLLSGSRGASGNTSGWLAALNGLRVIEACGGNSAHINQGLPGDGVNQLRQGDFVARGKEVVEAQHQRGASLERGGKEL